MNPTCEEALLALALGVYSATFSPEGARLATGSHGQEAVKLWDTAHYQDLLTLPGGGSLFYSTAFSPGGNVIGSVNQAGVLHLLRAPRGRKSRRRRKPNRPWVSRGMPAEMCD